MPTLMRYCVLRAAEVIPLNSVPFVILAMMRYIDVKTASAGGSSCVKRAAFRGTRRILSMSYRFVFSLPIPFNMLTVCVGMEWTLFRTYFPYRPRVCGATRPFVPPAMQQSPRRPQEIYSRPYQWSTLPQCSVLRMYEHRRCWNVGSAAPPL